jgi:multidrug efflux system membrane fusion protein
MNDQSHTIGLRVEHAEPLQKKKVARAHGRRWLAWLVVVAAAVGTLSWRQPWRRSAPNMPPAEVAQAVGVTTATVGEMPIVLTALGTVTPLATVTIKSQISGYLTRVAFEEGQAVRKDDLLAQIDARPYEALLAQYQGQLRKDQALLKNAQLDLARYQRLTVQDAISRQTVDTQAATVQQYEGTVASDQALVDAQKLNIAYCRIVSPIDGRVGLRKVDAGNYVQASDTDGIVVVTQLHPISVKFSLPEDQIVQVMKRLRAGAALTVTAYDKSDATAIATGTLQTVDNQIDTTTGTVKLRAVFSNENDALFPNQFVNVKLLVDTQKGVTVVPTPGIRHGTPGAYVYRVNADSTVSAAPVQTGASDGARTVVASGLVPGDRVVTDGGDRLRDGAKVRIPADPQTGRDVASERQALDR